MKEGPRPYSDTMAFHLSTLPLSMGMLSSPVESSPEVKSIKLGDDPLAVPEPNSNNAFNSISAPATSYSSRASFPNPIGSRQRITDPGIVSTAYQQQQQQQQQQQHQQQQQPSSLPNRHQRINNGHGSNFSGNHVRPSSEMLPVSYMHNATEAEAIERWFEDLNHYEQTLEEMSTTKVTLAFSTEMDAVEQWFCNSLNNCERTTTLYTLLQHCTQLQIRFLLQVLHRMAHKDPMSAILTPGLDADDKIESKNDKAAADHMASKKMLQVLPVRPTSTSSIPLSTARPQQQQQQQQQQQYSRRLFDRHSHPNPLSSPAGFGYAESGSHRFSADVLGSLVDNGEDDLDDLPYIVGLSNENPHNNSNSNSNNNNNSSFNSNYNGNTNSNNTGDNNAAAAAFSAAAGAISNGGTSIVARDSGAGFDLAGNPHTAPGSPNRFSHPSADGSPSQLGRPPSLLLSNMSPASASNSGYFIIASSSSGSGSGSASGSSSAVSAAVSSVIGMDKRFSPASSPLVLAPVLSSPQSTSSPSSLSSSSSSSSTSTSSSTTSSSSSSQSFSASNANGNNVPTLASQTMHSRYYRQNNLMNNATGAASYQQQQQQQQQQQLSHLQQYSQIPYSYSQLLQMHHATVNGTGNTDHNLINSNSSSSKVLQHHSTGHYMVSQPQLSPQSQVQQNALPFHHLQHQQQQYHQSNNQYYQQQQQQLLLQQTNSNQQPNSAFALDTSSLTGKEELSTAMGLLSPSSTSNPPHLLSPLYSVASMRFMPTSRVGGGNGNHASPRNSMFYDDAMSMQAYEDGDEVSSISGGTHRGGEQNGTGRVNHPKSPAAASSLELIKDIPTWLRSQRLHKYTPLFESMDWQTMIDMTDERLQELGIAALGARRKLLKSFEMAKKEMEAKNPSTNGNTSAPDSASSGSGSDRNSI